MAMIQSSMMIVVLSNVFYHICQKSNSASINPFVSLIVTYVTAIVLSIAIILSSPSGVRVIGTLKEINWSSVALGCTIVGLEYGFMLVYRAGWNVSIAAVYANVLVAIFLIPIGLLLYKESISKLNMVGIIMCLMGLALMKKHDPSDNNAKYPTETMASLKNGYWFEFIRSRLG